MKKVMVGIAALTCIAMTSCGNMGQVLGAMTNGTGVVNAISSVIGLDGISMVYVTVGRGFWVSEDVFKKGVRFTSIVSSVIPSRLSYQV